MFSAEEELWGDVGSENYVYTSCSARGYNLLHDELYAEYESGEDRRQSQEDRDDGLHHHVHQVEDGQGLERLMPKFLSQPLDIIANQGNTLRLPCRVDRLQVNMVPLLYRVYCNLKNDNIIHFYGDTYSNKKTVFKSDSTHHNFKNHSMLLFLDANIFVRFKFICYYFGNHLIK